MILNKKSLYSKQTTKPLYFYQKLIYLKLNKKKIIEMKKLRIIIQIKNLINKKKQFIMDLDLKLWVY